MPTTGNSDALELVLASAPAGVDLWQTLTLEHPSWAAPYYLTNAAAGFSVRLEDGTWVHFDPFPFALVLPTVDGAGQQELQVTLTNADQSIADAIQLAHATPQQRITATWRAYLSNGALGQMPQSPPLRLAFDSIQITEEAVTGVAGRSDVLNRRFPGVWYDIAHFPGLDR